MWGIVESHRQLWKNAAGLPLTLVDALLDRLRHHCITIRIDGPSLREPAPVDVDPTISPSSHGIAAGVKRRRTA